MNQLTIHSKIVARLAVGWFGLSITIGAVAVITEIRRLNEFVVDLALLESKSFTSWREDRINSPDPGHRAVLLEQSKEHLAKGHFILVRLYGRDGRRILSIGLPGTGSGRDYQEKFKPDTVDYRTFLVRGAPAVHVSVPLMQRPGEITGRFEGVYLADPKTASFIRGHVTSALVQTALVVLLTTLLLYPIIIAMNRDLLKLTVNLSKANIGMLKVLGSAVAKRDSDTNSHNFRVTLYAVGLAEAVGLTADAIRKLMKGAFLHDLGKIGISDAILLKPGKLNPGEFAIMKTHPQHGADIIRGYTWLQDALDVVMHHHEKFDGTGYPAGLKGENIPLTARIFSIADVFDALTSRRPYKPAIPFEEAMTILKQESGEFHDPRLLAAFSVQAEDLYRRIGSADDAVLEEMLNNLIEKHFPG